MSTKRRNKRLAALPSVGADASDAVKLGLRLRNEASLTGRCSCGGAVGAPVEIAPGIFKATIHHEADCPAISPELERAARRGELR